MREPKVKSLYPTKLSAQTILSEPLGSDHQFTVKFMTWTTPFRLRLVAAQRAQLAPTGRSIPVPPQR
jgi:hypothetical protein